ncbi:hypothetical protein [Breznakia pachnodae]|uniref:GNAT family acetyltransferase n=1 Tax=Breznakia pachnodae TaxID=265178 RepID=A0ABU0E410_9FIRM|nr:hypothetical protein [Breznakia pachnodae]MDQ0361637.1 putative GNAT family acetyltransferase [Breznakia pachnodae]
MKYLTEKYWINFEKKVVIKGVKKIIKDGKKFENLIKDLLALEYGDNKWVPTQDSWDGSKDFYFYNDNNKWAECKNYKSDISLNTLSPTLVMAEIKGIDEILFFCYSQIIDNARYKIINFCNRTNKIVKFYDDTTLEQLIIKHRNKLSDFFDFTKLENDINFIEDPLIDYSINKDFLMNYDVKINEDVIKRDLHDINVDELFRIDIAITNRIMKEIKILLKFDNKDIYQLENIEFITFSEMKYENAVIDIDGNDSKIISIILKVKSYTEWLHIPNIEIEEVNSKFKYSISFSSIKCNFLKTPKLIGSSYRDKLDLFKNKGLREYYFSSFLLFGQSGVGKTKLSKSMLEEGLRKKFNILKFYGDNSNNNDNYSVNTLLKELIYSVYNIPDVDTLYSSEIEIYGENDNSNNTSYAFHLIKEVFSLKKEEETIKFIDEKIKELFYLLFSNKYLLIIDNVQYFDNLSLFLIQKLITYGLESNRECNLCLVLIFNVDYITPNSRLEKYFENLLRLNDKIYPIHLKGFKDKGESKQYLKQLLSGIEFDEQSLKKIINKSSNNPYVIKEVVLWLEDNNCIKYEDNSYHIRDHNKFSKMIEIIPDSVNKLLENRWKKFCECDKSLRIISAIHFLDGLKLNDINLYNLSKESISLLLKHKFISIDEMDKNLYIFDHDLIENFFIDRDSSLSEIFINWIGLEKLNDMNLDFFRSYYIQLLTPNNKSSLKALSLVLDDLSFLEIPQKLKYDFYTIIFKKLFFAFNHTKNKNDWLELCFKYLQITHHNTKNIFIRDLYEKVYSKVELSEEIPKITKEYYSFILYYTELLDSIGNYNKAIQITMKLCKLFEKEKNTVSKNYELNVGYSYLLNRLNVYERHKHNFPINSSIILNYLEQSLSISKEINDDIMIYTNYSDFGYMYFIDRNYTKTVLSYWEKAASFFEEKEAIDSPVKEKKLNYYRKKTQIAIISHDFKMASKYCSYGIDYIENGEYSYQKILFRRWFSIANIAILLLNYSNKKNSEIESALQNADDYEILMDSPKKFVVSYLRSIYYFKIRDENRMITSIIQTYFLLKDSTYCTYKSNIINQFLDNIIIMCKNVNIKKLRLEFEEFDNSDYNQIFSILGYSINKFNIYIDNYEPTAIIHEDIYKLNYPEI